MAENLTDRVAKFTNVISNRNLLRSPLKILCDIGLVNHIIKPYAQNSTN